MRRQVRTTNRDPTSGRRPLKEHSLERMKLLKKAARTVALGSPERFCKILAEQNQVISNDEEKENA